MEDRLTGFGVRAKAYRSNAGVFAESEAFVNDVVKEFGTVDICVNNAGISKDNLLLRMSQEQWDDVIRVNLGAFHLASVSGVLFRDGNANGWPDSTETGLANRLVFADSNGNGIVQLPLAPIATVQVRPSTQSARAPPKIGVR